MDFSQCTKKSKNEKTNFPYNTSCSCGFGFRNNKPADIAIFGDGTHYSSSPEIITDKVISVFDKTNCQSLF